MLKQWQTVCNAVQDLIGLGFELSTSGHNSKYCSLVICKFAQCTHGRRQRGAGRGAAAPSWIFKHGTNIVHRGLKVLFSAVFCYFGRFFRCSPGRGQIVLFFGIFLLIFGLFFVGSPAPGKFSADALECTVHQNKNSAIARTFNACLINVHSSVFIDSTDMSL